MTRKPIGLIGKVWILLGLQIVTVVVGGILGHFLPVLRPAFLAVGAGCFVIGVFSGPLLLLRGLIHKYRSNWVAGLILLVFNTLPFALVICFTPPKIVYQKVPEDIKGKVTITVETNGTFYLGKKDLSPEEITDLLRKNGATNLIPYSKRTVFRK